MFLACCCGSCSMLLRIVVQGACGQTYVPGATVTVTGPGGFSDSALTDSSGVALFLLTNSGTYSYTITKAGYTTLVGSTTVASCADKTVTVTLVKAAGYSCYSCCAGPVDARTLYVSGPFGSTSFSWAGSTVCFAATSPNACTPVSGTCFGFPHTFMDVGSAAVAVSFYMDCVGPGRDLSVGWLATRGEPPGSCGFGFYYAPSPSHCSGSTIVDDGCGGLTGGFISGYTAAVSGTCENGVINLTATFPSTFIAPDGVSTSYFPFPGTWTITN